MSNRNKPTVINLKINWPMFRVYIIIFVLGGILGSYINMIYTSWIFLMCIIIAFTYLMESINDEK